MTVNLMELYIKNVKIFLKDFTKTFFDNKYVDAISNEYINTYIDSRFYNIKEESGRYFYTTIYNNLTNKKEFLKRDYGKKDEQMLEDNLKIYQYIFFVDNVRSLPDLNELVNTIKEKRISEYGLKEIPDINVTFTKLIKEYFNFKKVFFNTFKTDDFELKTQKYILIDNTYKVELAHNFRIPYIYSEKVISEVYNSGVINEDKNIIEYTMLTVECIKDIDNCNFDKRYIVDFARTLFEKPQKINQSLRIMNNVAIQEKVFFKLEYQDYTENIDYIHELIGEGYNFALILDDTFETNLLELRKLDIFKYVIVHKNTIVYDGIQDYADNINNIIIYE